MRWFGDDKPEMLLSERAAMMVENAERKMRPRAALVGRHWLPLYEYHFPDGHILREVAPRENNSARYVFLVLVDETDQELPETRWTEDEIQGLKIGEWQRHSEVKLTSRAKVMVQAAKASYDGMLSPVEYGPRMPLKKYTFADGRVYYEWPQSHAGSESTLCVYLVLEDGSTVEGSQWTSADYADLYPF